MLLLTDRQTHSWHVSIHAAKWMGGEAGKYVCGCERNRQTSWQRRLAVMDEHMDGQTQRTRMVMKKYSR